MSKGTDRSVAIRGGIWMSISTVVTMMAQIVRLMILTRYLEKSDFGIVAIATMIIGLCETFTDLGFASVIMYKQKLTNKEFSSLYWIQFLLFGSIYCLLFVLSPISASFYSEPMLTIVIPLSSLAVFGQAIGKLYDSILQKKYLFKALAFRNIFSVILSLGLAWWLAAHNYGVYSMIYSTLFSVFFVNLWNFISGYRIQPVTLYLNIKEVFPLMKIGIYQTGAHILDYLSNKLDIIIIGKLVGSEGLGVYNLAKELVVRFVHLIRTVVQKVALPIISNNNQDAAAVRAKFLTVTKIVAYVCIPICITVAVFSKVIVRILYGESFIEVFPIVSIFAVCSMIKSISSFIGMLGIAKGRTDLNFRQTIYRVIITTPIIILTSLFGLMTVAWGQLLITALCITVNWNTVVRGTYPMPFRLYYSQFSHYLIVYCIIGAVVGLLQFVNIVNSEYWILNVLIYGSIYVILILLAARYLLKEEVTYLLSFINKKKK